MHTGKQKIFFGLAPKSVTCDYPSLIEREAGVGHVSSGAESNRRASTAADPVRPGLASGTSSHLVARILTLYRVSPMTLNEHSRVHGDKKYSQVQLRGGTVLALRTTKTRTSCSPSRFQYEFSCSGVKLSSKNLRNLLSVPLQRLFNTRNGGTRNQVGRDGRIHSSDNRVAPNYQTSADLANGRNRLRSE